MIITSAKFIKGVVGPDDILLDGTPQIAFIGRSNAGKSSLLNSLTNNKKLAIASKTPGRTKEINVFLINNTHYFMDLPGYGFAKAGAETLDKLSDLIYWYIFEFPHSRMVVLLIDANVGPTKDDLGMLQELQNAGKELIIVRNKVDKIKKSQYRNRIKELTDLFRGHTVIPYSSTTKVGITELQHALLHTRV